jgi:transcriptional regulator with XRE-family HTH domain
MSRTSLKIRVLRQHCQLSRELGEEQTGVYMRMSPEIRQAIGNALRKARVDANKTQSHVAREVGLSRQMICRYEKGHDAPTGENLGKLLRHFGISIELPGYAWRLTAEALETAKARPLPLSQQLTLELNKPQEVHNAKVRIVRKEDSIEIVIAEFSFAM